MTTGQRVSPPKGTRSTHRQRYVSPIRSDDIADYMRLNIGHSLAETLLDDLCPFSALYLDSYRWPGLQLVEAPPGIDPVRRDIARAWSEVGILLYKAVARAGYDGGLQSDGSDTRGTRTE